MLLSVQVSAPETVSSVSVIKLYNAMGNETLVTASATPVTGRTEGVFTASVTLPNEVGCPYKLSPNIRRIFSCLLPQAESFFFGKTTTE